MAANGPNGQLPVDDEEVDGAGVEGVEVDGAGAPGGGAGGAGRTATRSAVSCVRLSWLPSAMIRVPTDTADELAWEVPS